MIAAELSKKLNILPSDQLWVINPLNFAVNTPSNSETINSPSWVCIVSTKVDELTSLVSQHKETLLNARSIWIYYPKKTGRIKSDLSRDVCWKILVPQGFTPNSQISIDETWSALRFKPIEKTSIWVEKLLNQTKEKAKPKERLPIVIPNELMFEFEEYPNAKNFFDTLSYSCQREYVNYISEAKKEETRISRTKKTIEALLSHKKNRN